MEPLAWYLRLRGRARARTFLVGLQDLLESLAGQEQGAGPQDVPDVELGDRRELRAVDVPGGPLEALVAARQGQQAAPVDAEGLVHLGHQRGLGLLQRDLIDDADVVALDLAEDSV